MRSRLLAAALALAGVLGGAQAALAWGALGHRTIAAIAEANIAPRTHAAIAGLLRAEAALGTPDCRVESLADASVWPDCLRGLSGGPGVEHGDNRWQPTFAWHYQDGPVCAADFDPRVACPDGACVTAQIARNRAILANRALPAGQRLQALAFLAHFVGDVHQPFHAADDGDKGGNTEIVSNLAPTPARGDWPARPVSLHWFWDETLVVRALAAPAPHGSLALVRRYTPLERDRIATGGPVDWARESWRIAVRLAYPQALGPHALSGPACGRAPPASVTISDADAARDLPVVRQRLTQAGLRLARMLDGALGG